MLTAFASFLADSEGEEQDDGFLGLAKAPTVYLSQNKWLSLMQKLCLSRRKTVIGREPLTKRESMASLIHDTSPTLRHSLQQSHNKGLYYGFRDAILSRLVTIIKRLVHHAVYCITLSRLLSFLCNPYRENFRGILRSNYYVGVALVHVQRTNICAACAASLACALWISKHLRRKLSEIVLNQQKKTKFYPSKVFHYSVYYYSTRKKEGH